MRFLVALACVSWGCGDGEHFLVVTVEARRGVSGVDALRVTLANDGTMRTDDLPIGKATFPVTFSISAPGRSGDLTLTIEAIDGGGLVVGKGAGSTTLEDATATVTLDPLDFVVNTEYADDQYPSFYLDTHGFSAGAMPDGRWSVAFRDGCLTPPGCHMYGRQFGPDGVPATTTLGAGTNQFEVSTTLTTDASSVAVAGGGSVTMFAWSARNQIGFPPIPSIACRALDAQGKATNSSELDISDDDEADVVSLAPLSNNNFAMVWQGGSPLTIRSAIVEPDCTVAAASPPVSVSTTPGGLRPAVTSIGTPSTILYAWIVNGAVFLRLATESNTLVSGSDTMFVAPTASEEVEFVRVAPLGTGFAVVVRWVQKGQFTGPGRLELHRASSTGARVGEPVVISTKAGSDFGSRESFGVATRADGTMLVVWHGCDANGDGQGCGVWGRAFSGDGTPITPEIGIPTTIVGDQTNASVVALPDAFAVTWRDQSLQPPDVSGAAVRARIVYPAGSSSAR